MGSDYALDDIKTIVRNCLDKLYNDDSILFERNNRKGVCERSLVFRFAYYLQLKFKDYYVDCDFNSSYNGNKDRNGKPIRNKDGTYTKRFIDIIIHKRDKDNNLVCFEIKKWNNVNKENIKKDKSNLRYLTTKYGYKYGFHIIIHNKYQTKTKCSIFKNGEVVEKGEAFKDERN